MIAAGAGDAIQVKDHMTKLTADSVRTAPNLVIDDNTAADTRSYCDKYA